MQTTFSHDDDGLRVSGLAPVAAMAVVAPSLPGAQAISAHSEQTHRAATEPGARGPAAEPLWAALVQAIRYGGTILLAAGVAAFVILSRHWPVVNDAALMHYVVLLEEHGLAPYRAIDDVNMPGAYLPDWLAMRVAGTGSAGDLVWRVYDLGLLGVAAVAMMVIALPYDWFAGVFAAALFALFHGRDGIGQAGQRDLAMAVLDLVAAAALLVATRRARPAAGPLAGCGTLALCGPLALCGLFALCGLALGAATTIKPFGVIYLAAALLYAMRELPAGQRWRAVLAAVAGFALPLGIAVTWLAREQAVGSFLAMCRVTLPFHALVVHTPIGKMLRAAWPLSFIKLGSLGLLIAVLRGGHGSRESRVLLGGVVLGLAGFFAQSKGYSYQRYPYSGFLLLWVALACTAAVRERRWLLRGLGAAGLLFGIASCAPSYLLAASRAQWPESYLGAMERDLRAEGGAQLDGRVQCLDSISGCVSVLYRLGLEQSTGTLYDEFLFPPARLRGRLPRAVVAARQAFLAELAARPPQVFLVSSWLFAQGPGEYQKLDLWPAFAGYLATNYRMVDQQSFARSENGPMGFRMYVRRGRGRPERWSGP